MTPGHISLLPLVAQHNNLTSIFKLDKSAVLSGKLLILELFRKKPPHINLVYRNPMRSLCSEASPQEAPQVFIMFWIFMFISFFSIIIHILTSKIRKGALIG